MSDTERLTHSSFGALRERLGSIRGIISDMDGVIYHGNRLLPGVPEFVQWLKDTDTSFVFLTNSSERSRRELKDKLSRMGVDVPLDNFYTSALATAGFLQSQKPGGSAYVVGEAGLIHALYDAGYTMNDVDPDYVVIGETRSYSFEKIEKAINLVMKGAKLIGTNPDLTGPVENGIIPACGALIQPIALATGVTPYFVGKPNPLMMRQALRRIGCRRARTTRSASASSRSASSAVRVTTAAAAPRARRWPAAAVRCPASRSTTSSAEPATTSAWPARPSSATCPPGSRG